MKNLIYYFTLLKQWNTKREISQSMVAGASRDFESFTSDSDTMNQE